MADVPLPPSRPPSLGGTRGNTNLASSQKKLKYEYHIPNLDKDHAKQYAKSKAKEHARHRVQVVVECVGDPSCRPGMQLQLSGTAFSGSYDIDSVEHRFGMQGHTMTITSRTDPGDAEEG